MEHLITLADHFTSAIINSDEIRTEWELFKNSGTTSDSLQLRIVRAEEVTTLLVENEDLVAMFPNLCRVALIDLLIPTSTADCERRFSTLK